MTPSARVNPLAAPRPEGTRSAIAIASHPLHAASVHFPIAYLFAGLVADLAYWWTADAFWARAALWAIGAGFATGCIAALFGMLEFLLVKEIRRFVASWSHFLAGVTLVALAATNWWGRVADPAAGVLPWGLVLSAVSLLGIGWAGVLGGKLVYEHNVARDTDDGQPARGARTASRRRAPPRPR
jgi:uncharacterized membrane protein